MKVPKYSRTQVPEIASSSSQLDTVADVQSLNIGHFTPPQASDS